MNLQEWLDAYFDIWRNNEYSPELVKKLFTEDAVYRPNVLRTLEEPYIGQGRIMDYLDRWVPVVKWEKVIMRTPIVTGPNVAVEVWIYGHAEGIPTTEALCSVLSFAPDHRCMELRDYVQIIETIEHPYADW